jgi:hypothetical protein
MLRTWDWVCGDHGGSIPTATGSCPPADTQCGAIVRGVRMDRPGRPRFPEPTPTHCAGAGKHPVGGTVRMDWSPWPRAPGRRPVATRKLALFNPTAGT